MKVREIIKRIEADGWYMVAMKASHRQFKHPNKTGRVTISGHPNDDLAPGTLNSIMKQEITMYRFLIVIEKAENNYSAYAPDLPGCIATGKTREEAEKNMHEAVQFHLQGLRDDALPIPESQSFAEYIAVE